VKDIVQPAVQGTRTVLEAAAKYKGAGGLRRVVVTSSVCGEAAPAAGCWIAIWRCSSHAPAALPPPQHTCPAHHPTHATLATAIHDMNRKQVPQAEQYCEADWNSVSTIEDEAYWVSKVCAWFDAALRAWAFVACTQLALSGRCAATAALVLVASHTHCDRLRLRSWRGSWRRSWGSTWSPSCPTLCW
jgi:hypothetical protein